MTFTYTLPIASSRDSLRLHIADTLATPHVFEDEELDEVLSLEGGDVLLSAARCLRIMAADGSRRAIAVQLPGFNLTKGNAIATLQSMAVAFEEQAKQRARPDQVSVFPQTDAYLDAISGAHDLDFERPTGAP